MNGRLAIVPIIFSSRVGSSETTLISRRGTFTNKLCFVIEKLLTRMEL